MALYRNNKRTKKKGKYSKLEQFAYNMGLVQQGLDKGGNKVTDSYNNGRKEREKREKKPLI